MANETGPEQFQPAGATPDKSANPAQPSGPGGQGVHSGHPGTSAGGGGDAGLEALKQQLAEAQARASSQYDAYVRAHAEMENIRRRAQDDVAKAHKYAIESFAESLLAVHDSLEMALKTDKVTVDTMRAGVEATLKQLASVFERNKLLEINPLGGKFDPNLHQAISMVPGNSVQPPVPANHVVTVLQKGYLINDRILRPALVTVAQG